MQVSFSKQKKKRGENGLQARDDQKDDRAGARVSGRDDRDSGRDEPERTAGTDTEKRRNKRGGKSMIVESEMKQKKETSRGIYSEIYDLIVNMADEAEDKVEAACDKMMESDVDPKSVLGEELVETIKENRKRYKELSDLLARFEEEAMEKIVNEIKEAERNGWTYGCNDEKDA